MAKSKTPPPAQVARARRLESLIERGPRSPRSPHEFVEQKMRDERRTPTKAPGGKKKR